MRAFSTIISLLFLLFFVGFPSEPQIVKPPKYSDIEAPQGGLASIYLRDSFMRTDFAYGEWTIAEGDWTVSSLYQSETSANPFKAMPVAGNSALIEAGELWWKNYYYHISLRTPESYDQYGIEALRRNKGDYLFFGFSREHGLILQLTFEGKTKVLGNKNIHPYQNQWYQLALAQREDRLIAMIDGTEVFSVTLPRTLTGRVGVYAKGGDISSLEIDDAIVRSIDDSYTDGELSASKLAAFLDLVLPPAHKANDYFQHDEVMTQWASDASDWKPDYQGSNTLHPYFVPLFNDFTLKLEPSKLRNDCRITVRELDSENTLLEIVIARNKNEIEFTSFKGGKEYETLTAKIDLTGFTSIQLLTNRICVFSGQVLQELTGKGIPELANGVQLFAAHPTYLTILRYCPVYVSSTHLISDTFSQTPHRWFGAAGMWNITSRWSCSPQYSYLSSHEQMTSQLYTKNKFSGDLFVEAWMAPCMSSYRPPFYFPYNWLAMSIPHQYGDYSKGLLASAFNPQRNTPSLSVDGNQILLKTRGPANVWLNHNSWRTFYYSRTLTDEHLDIHFTEGSQSSDSFTSSSYNEPRPICLWNARTGFSIAKATISARNISDIDFEHIFTSNYTGTHADPIEAVQLIAEPNVPSFDFSIGTCNWKLDEAQNTAQITPPSSTQNFTTLSSLFRGCSYQFNSPNLFTPAASVDSITISYSSNIPLALYIETDKQLLSAQLNGSWKPNISDISVIIPQDFISVETTNGWSKATINMSSFLSSAFYNLVAPRTITRLFLACRDIENVRSLGLTGVSSTELYKLKSISVHSKGNLRTVQDTYSSGMTVATLQENPPKNAVLPSNPHHDDYLPLYPSNSNHITQIGAYDEGALYIEEKNNRKNLVLRKNGNDGFYGLSLISNPICISEYPAISIVTGRIMPRNLTLAVKGDAGWEGISTSILSFRYPLGTITADGVTRCLYVIELKDLKSSYITDMLLYSGFNARTAIGEVLSIESITLFDPDAIAPCISKAHFEFLLSSKIIDKQFGTIQTPQCNIPVFHRGGTRLFDAGICNKEISSNAVSFELPSRKVSNLSLTVNGFSFDSSYFSANGKTVSVEFDKVPGIRTGANSYEIHLLENGKHKKVISGTYEAKENQPAKVDSILIVPEDALCFEGFEDGIGKGGSRCSPTFLAHTPFSGNYCLEAFRIFDEPYFSSFLHNTSYDAAQYPFIAFNYRLPSNTHLSLMFKCEGHFKDLAFSPCEPNLRNYKHNIQYIGGHWGMTLGVPSRIEGIVADSKWHFVKLNVLDQLDAELINGCYPIEKVCLREQARNDRFSWVQIDNFTIYAGKSHKRTASWEAPLTPANSNAEISYTWYLEDENGTAVSDKHQTTETSISFTLPQKKGNYWLVVQIDEEQSFCKKIPAQIGRALIP